MGLQTSGQIKASEIANELGITLSNVSLGNMDNNSLGRTGGNKNMSAFYGYSSVITVSADVLIVGGGGTGNNGSGLRCTSTAGYTGGGGGAGGYRSFTNVNVSTNDVIIVGGAGSLSCLSSVGEAPPGGNGSRAGLTGPSTQGSGGGGSIYVCANSPNKCGQIVYVVQTANGVTGVYGGNGGNAVWVDDACFSTLNGYITSGGGGGAGGNANGTVGGAGCTWFDGKTYAVGGDGAINCEATSKYRGCAGCTNAAPGSGGGGNFLNFTTLGRDGVVVIRYCSPTSCFTGGIVTCSGGHVYHCFTTSGTLC